MFRMIRLNPPNGWNAVAWELAIVVVGVLIALGAQQAVEERRWRDEVRLTEDALTIEIAELGPARQRAPDGQSLPK